MCLEVYAPKRDVQIPFEHERVRFESPTRLLTRYTFLVRNPGYEPIDKLLAIYPRPLFRPKIVARRDESTTGVLEYLPEHSLTDVTYILSESQDFVADEKNPNELTAELPDPNNPICLLNGLNGLWYPGNGRFSAVQGLSTRCYLLLQNHLYSSWEVHLSRPIEPGTAQWFCWEIGVDEVGCTLPDTVLGPAVFHELTSPIDVHRTFREAIQAAIRDLLTNKVETPTATIRRAQEVALREILFHLALLEERRVDIQYYELSLLTGDPKEMFLLNATELGDIRPRSGSPRVGMDDVLDADFIGQPIYEWKSGSIIEPAHPWRDSGFSLRLTMVYNKRSRPRVPRDKREISARLR
jgi:hypothetical protein